MRIFKYDISEQIKLPSGYKILKILCQDSFFGGGPKIWIEVNPENPETILDLSIIPTGGDVPKFSAYLDSFVTPGGLVFHVYKTPVPPAREE